MSPIEMARTVAAVALLVVAGYSAARFTWSVTRRGTRPFRSGIAAADVPDLSHALMGLAMALMVSPAGPAVPEPLGIVAFTALGAWFAARVWHDGVLSRAGAGGGEVRRLGVLGVLGNRGGHGGYHLHHVAGCAAMVLMYATGHGTLSHSGTTAAAPALQPAPSGALASTPSEALQSASSTLDTHAALGAHAAVPPLAALCWLFGLYFLVAATSLGFRVGESAVRVTHHAALPARSAAPAPRPPAAGRRSAARLLTSPAGGCASEVALSAGMAVLFFSAL